MHNRSLPRRVCLCCPTVSVHAQSQVVCQYLGTDQKIHQSLLVFQIICRVSHFNSRLTWLTHVLSTYQTNWVLSSTCDWFALRAHKTFLGFADFSLSRFVKFHLTIEIPMFCTSTSPRSLKTHRCTSKNVDYFPCIELSSSHQPTHLLTFALTHYSKQFSNYKSSFAIIVIHGRT